MIQRQRGQGSILRPVDGICGAVVAFQPGFQQLQGFVGGFLLGIGHVRAKDIGSCGPAAIQDDIPGCPLIRFPVGLRFRLLVRFLLRFLLRL